MNTQRSINEKYTSYVQGYKLDDGKKKTIYAFIVYADDQAIGYIQIYNAYDFARSKPLKYLAAIDFFIGEEEYLHKGLGTEILKDFDYQNYEYILVDPNINNIVAIKTYKKAGFKKSKEHIDTNEL